MISLMCGISATQQTSECNKKEKQAHRERDQTSGYQWLSFLSPGHLPHPGLESSSPALAGRFFTSEGKPKEAHRYV